MLQPSVIVFDNVEQLTSTTSPAGDLLASSFMSELSGVVDRGLVWVIGCTRNVDRVHEAFRMKGRFELEFEVEHPDDEVQVLYK